MWKRKLSIISKQVCGELGAEASSAKARLKPLKYHMVNIDVRNVAEYSNARRLK